MLGSAAQNVIALTDSILLYQVGETDFAAIGISGVFYLTIAAIGYGFSKGGQIIIARRMGEKNFEGVRRTFYDMLVFELLLALVLFVAIKFGSRFLFSYFVESPVVLQKCISYLDTRSYGIIFSYIGVALISTYTGIAKPWFVMVDTIFLAIVNYVLCLALIFGKWGFPALGISGAGLASTIAEMLAFALFLIFMYFDKNRKQLKLFKVIKPDWPETLNLIQLSLPIVAQSVIGLGAWFIFFGLIDNLGERALSVTNLVRMVYLCLSIPCWGFSSGINTLVSNLMGQKRYALIIPTIYRSIFLCLIITAILAIPVICYPEAILTKILGAMQHNDIIPYAVPTIRLLGLILIVFTGGAIFFNGLAGTGATKNGLYLQMFSAAAYLIIVYVIVNIVKGSVELAWSSEIYYWLIMLLFTMKFMYSKKWIHFKV
jgi:putative MATE family efflux protein